MFAFSPFLPFFLSLPCSSEITHPNKSRAGKCCFRLLFLQSLGSYWPVGLASIFLMQTIGFASVDNVIIKSYVCAVGIGLPCTDVGALLLTFSRLLAGAPLVLRVMWYICRHGFQGAAEQRQA